MHGNGVTNPPQNRPRRQLGRSLDTMNDTLRTGLAIVVGAVVGALGREALDVVMMAMSLPGIDGVLVANLMGAGALGFTSTALRTTVPTWLKLGLTTGLWGTFTTLSAISGFIAFTPTEFATELWWYVTASIVGGVAAAWAGLRAGEAIHGRGATA